MDFTIVESYEDAVTAVNNGGKWSNSKIELPKLDEYVNVGLNGIGKCKVIGYFTECGYIGIYVQPEKLNVRTTGNVYVFGAEVSEWVEDA